MKRLQLFFNYLQHSLTFIAIFLFLVTCQSEIQNETKIAKLPVKIELDRFDLKFYNQEETVIWKLKRDYPYLFPNQFSDSLWILRQKDSLQLILQEAVQEVFQDIAPLECKINHLFKYVLFIFQS